MKTNLRGRDFISTQEWTREELETVLHLAFDLKMKWGLDLPTRLLEDKNAPASPRLRRSPGIRRGTARAYSS